MQLLIDSVILIDHFNGYKEASNYLRDNWHKSFISMITRAEVLVGFEDAYLSTAKKLLNEMQILPITIEIIDLAAKLKRDYRWKLPDAIQASVAQSKHLKLVTRNTKDFSPEKHGFVTVPYSI